MNIYTKTGDKGETSLYGGTRVPKDSLRVDCYGTVDEANSLLGLLYATVQFGGIKEQVRTIQQKLFILAAQLASDEEGQKRLPQRIEKADIAYLESIIDAYTAEFGKMRHFTIPGETPGSALFHVARTVVRRCERQVTSLAREEFVCAYVMRYLNRLSDTLYVLAKREVFESFVQRVVERVHAATQTQAPGFWSHSLCEHIYRAAGAQSIACDVPICLSIVDEGGNLVYFQRQPGALLTSVGISQKKAYTAVAVNMTTRQLGEVSQPGDSLFGINTADRDLVIFGGGFPLRYDGGLVGGLGISGGSVEQDEQIGKAAVAAFHAMAQQWD